METAVKTASTTRAPIAAMGDGIEASNSTPTLALPPIPCAESYRECPGLGAHVVCPWSAAVIPNCCVATAED